MTQRLIIRLLPIEIFLFSLLTGWLAISGVRALIQSAPLRPTLAEAAPSTDTGGASTTLSPIFTPQVQHWAERIAAWAAPFQLDPNLVATVMQIESCGAPHVVSSSGAQGLFQVMPFHFAPEEPMQDPDTNAGRGLAYLALGLTRAGGNAGLALAGYNGGHSQIGKDASLWPEQTKRYWYWGTGIYQDAIGGQTQSSRLQEWLQAGGASLCAKADQELGLAR
ncbi:MAG: transglycosylase SLT domain-containing protein [Anaerolineales bacterium]